MLVSKGTKGYVKELGWLGDSGECLVAFDNGKAEMIPIVALRRI